MKIYLNAKLFSLTTVCALLLLFSSCQKGNSSKPDNLPDDVATDEPQIFDFSPLKGIPNTAIKIRGKDFKANIAENVVYVGNTQLQIVSMTSSEIMAILPANAAPGVGNVALHYSKHEIIAEKKFSVLRGTQSAFFEVFGGTVHHVGVDDLGNAYGHNGAGIFKLQTGGTMSPMTGTDDNFKSVGDFAINMQGDLYVANKGNFNIVKITPSKVTTVFAGTGVQGYQDGPGATAKFMSPSAIAYNLGTFYVIDGHRVRTVSASGVVATLAGSGTDGNVDGIGTNAQFGNLEDIAADADGTVYVTDSKYLNIRKITADGKVITLAGSGSRGFKDGMASAAEFTRPRGIAVDASKNLFVSDENSAIPYYAIRMVNQWGNVSTLIKGTANTAVLNGSLALSSTYSPLGLSFDSAGNLYIANSGSGTISKVSFGL